MEEFAGGSHRLYWFGDKNRPCELEYNGQTVAILALDSQIKKVAREVKMFRNPIPPNPKTGFPGSPGRMVRHIENVWVEDKSLPPNKKNWIDVPQDAFNHLMQAGKIEQAIVQNDGKYVTIGDETLPPLIPGFVLDRLQGREVDTKQEELAYLRAKLDSEADSAHAELEQLRKDKADVQAQRAAWQVELDNMKEEFQRQKEQMAAQLEELKAATSSKKKNGG